MNLMNTVEWGGGGEFVHFMYLIFWVPNYASVVISTHCIYLMWRMQIGRNKCINIAGCSRCKLWHYRMISSCCFTSEARNLLLGGEFPCTFVWLFKKRMIEGLKSETRGHIEVYMMRGRDRGWFWVVDVLKEMGIICMYDMTIIRWL